MRKILILAALPAILAASPALAQSATGTVNIDGSVAGRCMFTLPNATISLGELSLASNGKLDVSKVNGKTATLTGWCNNTAASMTVTTTQLTTATAATAEFDNRVDYTGTATANAISANDSSLTAGAGTASTVGQFTGNIVVVLSAASSPTNGLMVAGAYTGNVQVTLSPSL
ncbi:MAG: hypothetical protein C0515_04860 [Novosphingobium sp.]|nr:hypothetical protein [Novosphingobium sp.]MBX9644495.1 hypothetical protein [Novosphingobium sp.]